MMNYQYYWKVINKLIIGKWHQSMCIFIGLLLLTNMKCRVIIFIMHIYGFVASDRYVMQQNSFYEIIFMDFVASDEYDVQKNSFYMHLSNMKCSKIPFMCIFIGLLLLTNIM